MSKRASQLHDYIILAFEKNKIKTLVQQNKVRLDILNGHAAMITQSKAPHLCGKANNDQDSL